MVALLTGSGDGVLDPARMPGSDTGNLPQTLVSLARKFLTVPTASYALESMAFGDPNDVQNFILSKNLTHSDLFLKVRLIGNAATIQLNFHNMSLLLPAAQKF